MTNKKKKKNKKKFSTSKLILWATFLMCIEIIIFCQYAIIRLEDASSIYALIGAPVAFIPVVIGYFVKSKAENTSGGLVYESTMAELNSVVDYSVEEPDFIIDDGLVNEE